MTKVLRSDGNGGLYLTRIGVWIGALLVSILIGLGAWNLKATYDHSLALAAGPPMTASDGARIARTLYRWCEQRSPKSPHCDALLDIAEDLEKR